MPAQSKQQLKMIYAKRNQYGSEAKTPEKWKWVWGKDWGKMEGIDWNSFKDEDKLPGGEGDNTKPAEVDPKQLAVGMEVEREHGDDEEAVKETVLDHLTGDPEYYTKLIKAGLVDEKAALDKYKELYGSNENMNEGKLRMEIRKLIEAETSWGEIGKRDKQAKLDKAVKSGKATFEDKLDALEGGLKVKGLDDLKPGHIRALRNLLKYMSDDMQLEMNRMDGKALIKFIGNLQAAL